jgi:spermidine/putrescine transport system substrate-binding protein
MSRRRFIGRSAGVALSVGGLGSFVAACGGDGGGGSGGSGEVNVLSWVSYVDPTVKRLFEKAYPGVKMNGIAADADQTMFTKVKAGGAQQYDIVFCNAGWSPTYLENDLVEPIDLSQIPSARELFPAFRENTDIPFVLEPGTVGLYPNMWAPLSLTWNTTVPFQPPAPYSWSALWSEKVPDNKVMLQGGGDDLIVITGLEQGVPAEELYSMSGATLKRVEDRLRSLKPFQLNPNVLPQFREAIRTERAWLGLTSDLSAGFLIDQEAGEDVAESVIPQEGTIGWIDGPQLVKGARNRENALKFLDFFAGNRELLQYLWEEYRFAQCNQRQVQRILEAGGEDAQLLQAIRGDDPKVAAQLTFQRPADDPREWAAAWDRIQGA